MTSTSARPWAPASLVLLTLVWVLALLGLMMWLFAIGMEGWADTEGTRTAEVGRKTSIALLVLASVAMGGPIVVAIVARAGELVRTAMVYVVLAVVLGLVAVPVAAGAYRSLTPPPSPLPVAPGGCQEHSGGDTRCPGG